MKFNTDFTIISGLSGSGKGVALRSLEDIGYYCIDNLPALMLSELVHALRSGRLGKQLTPGLGGVAISIDVRSQESFSELDEQLDFLKEYAINTRILFIEAEKETLIKRYSETRRRHPLSDWQIPLPDAIDMERELLAPLKERAHKTIDTSAMTPHELRALIRDYTGGAKWGPLFVLESFGFKYGSPREADFVFDIRCLPNPHWDPNLRALTGLDEPVKEFLSRQEIVQEMQHDIFHFLKKWLPGFVSENRSYITVAIGCTGGQHRSVYLCEALKGMLLEQSINVQTRHRELS